MRKYASVRSLKSAKKLITDKYLGRSNGWCRSGARLLSSLLAFLGWRKYRLLPAVPLAYLGPGTWDHLQTSYALYGGDQISCSQLTQKDGSEASVTDKRESRTNDTSNPDVDDPSQAAFSAAILNRQSDGPKRLIACRTKGQAFDVNGRR
ncbi:hypothetical protein VTL71DRAFT_6032 [Oculimacula yallundae]|uniref:Uncharacterized protein n=1 Tax=Oculimacula yallundae TaxID=86028 RepID=A0ABR4BZB4_9HELO